MKLSIFFILLMFVPEFGIAQEMVQEENIVLNQNEQDIAPQSRAGRVRPPAANAHAKNPMIELNALFGGSKFTADTDLYREIKQTDHPEPGIIGAWRQRIFNILRTHSSDSRRPDFVNDHWLKSNNELDEQANESRMVTRLVLKETLRFAQERVPEIDKLVKVLRLEVSTGMISSKNSEEEAGDHKISDTRAVDRKIAKDKLSIKTGLRVPVESGKVALVSETEASYGDVSSFVKVNLDGQYDNTVGLMYVIGRDLHLQIERRVSHAADPVTNDKTNARSSLNLIHFVCKF